MELATFAKTYADFYAPAYAIRLGREVTRAELARGRREPLELCRRQPDANLSVEDADGRRHGTGFPNPPLALEPDLDAVRSRKAVGDERRLERHDRPPFGERSRDLLGHPDHPASLPAARGQNPCRERRGAERGEDGLRR